MNNTIQIINTVLPVIIMLVIGVICRRCSILTREGIKALKSVAVNITLPAVMLNAFATMDYSIKNIIVTLLMFFVCIVAWLLGLLVSKVFKMKSRFIPLLTTGFEAGMLGYSLFALLYGQSNIGRFATVDLGQALFVFTLYKILSGMDGSQKYTAKMIVKDMITAPTFIALVVGVLMGATGLYSLLIPSGANTIMDSCTSFISAPTSAIILISIGYDLVPSEIPWFDVGKVSLLRVAIMLGLRIPAGFVVRGFGLGDTFDQALNVMFILPAPYVLPVFADDENQRAYVSSTLSVSTCIAIIGFIVLAII